MGALIVILIVLFFVFRPRVGVTLSYGRTITIGHKPAAKRPVKRRRR